MRRKKAVFGKRTTKMRKEVALSRRLALNHALILSEHDLLFGIGGGLGKVLVAQRQPSCGEKNTTTKTGEGGSSETEPSPNSNPNLIRAQVPV